MNFTNEIVLELEAISVNEGLARLVVAGFVSELNPTLEEIADIKTAVSEAVTNAIIHGYNGKAGKVTLHCKIEDTLLTVIVCDKGVGIEDVEKAKENLYTTRPDLERSGMGFAFMEAFMDELEVSSTIGEGTTIKMCKRIKSE